MLRSGPARDESNWLGWLTITEEQLANIDALKQIADDVKKARFKHALLLGMGGFQPLPGSFCV